MYHVKTLDYHNLSSQKQAEWLDKLFVVGQESMLDIDKSTFYDFIFGKAGLEQSYYVLQAENGTIAGFFSIYHQTVQIKGRSMILFGTVLLVASKSRGKQLFSKAMIQIFKDFGFMGIMRRGYWVSNAVNPISYHAITDKAWRSFPRKNQPLSSEIMAVIEKFAEINHKQLEPTLDAGVKFTKGIPPRYTGNQLERIYQSSNKNIRYYIEQGVDFENGEGLPIVFKLTFMNITMSFFKVLKSILLKKL